MKKQIRSFRTFIFILFLLELLGIATFSVLYYLDLFEFQSRAMNHVPLMVFTVMGVAIINILVSWIAVLLFRKARRETDIKAASLLGDDIQEAYNFGSIGLVIVDENNVVLWTNELFRDRKIDILDTNIVEWLPDLGELSESSSTSIVKVEIKDRNYDVKFLSDAGLYIFKDTTEFETISKFAKDEAVVLGFIMIDNFSNISENADDASDIVSKVRNEIFEYTQDFNVLIRRYKNDTYFMVCNYDSLHKMEEDKFSLLDRIHKIGEKEPTPPTLSIGIAHDFPGVNKLNEMASTALEICMSRGGDQVVVSKYGQDLQYYGGKSKAAEIKNKVKIRVISDSALSIIKASKEVLLMGHSMADMDAIGSCLGMKAMCEYAKKPSYVVYDPHNTESKTRGAMMSAFSRDELSKITISPSDAIEKAKSLSNVLLIVCDVHNPTMVICPQLLDLVDKIMIIDHHRRSEHYIENNIFSQIDPGASSASEMVTEYIHYSSSNPRIEIPPAYATIMLSGIFLDSNYFKSKSTSSNTFEASMVLKEYGADNYKADDYLKDEYEEYQLITKISASLTSPYYGVVYCKADESDFIEPATLAKVANHCMQMKGVNAVFVIGRVSEKEVRISCRSDGTISVQLLAEKMNGGGHQHMAAASFKNLKIDEVEIRLLDVLKEYLSDARATSERR